MNSLLDRPELAKKLQKPSAGTGVAIFSSIFFELVRDSKMFLLWHSRLYSMVMLVKLCVSKCSSGTLCNQEGIVLILLKRILKTYEKIA